MIEVIRTESEEQTAEVARRLASGLSPGAVVLLTGDLGSGKTAFVRGLAAGLGLDPDEISSPTFTLVQEYRPSAGSPGRDRPDGRGAFVLVHVDLYRLDGAEVDDLGLDELPEAGAVVAVEWAEKLRAAPDAALRVTIVDLGGNAREVRITPTGSWALPW